MSGLWVFHAAPPSSSGRFLINCGDVSVRRHLLPWLDGVQELSKAVTTHNAQWTMISCYELGDQPSNCGSAFSRTLANNCWQCRLLFEEAGPPKERVYSSVCFADKCEARLVMLPLWTSCIPHHLHHTFTTFFLFSLIATGTSKYCQTGLVRFLVDIWSVLGPTPASSYLNLNKWLYSLGRNNDIRILDYKRLSG